MCCWFCTFCVSPSKKRVQPHRERTFFSHSTQELQLPPSDAVVCQVNDLSQKIPHPPPFVESSTPYVVCMTPAPVYTSLTPQAPIRKISLDGRGDHGEESHQRLSSCQHGGAFHPQGFDVGQLHARQGTTSASSEVQDLSVSLFTLAFQLILAAKSSYHSMDAETSMLQTISKHPFFLYALKECLGM